jgi:hypothetical protein
MRGSAQLVSDVSSPAALRAAWQGNFRSPVHPLDQEAALPLVGSPHPSIDGSDLSRSDTPGCHERGKAVRAFTAPAQGALLPETPAQTKTPAVRAMSLLRCTVRA